MLAEEKQSFDGFYIPVIPDVDYLSDRGYTRLRFSALTELTDRFEKYGRD